MNNQKTYTQEDFYKEVALLNNLDTYKNKLNEMLETLNDVEFIVPEVEVEEFKTIFNYLKDNKIIDIKLSDLSNISEMLKNIKISISSIDNYIGKNDINNILDKYEYTSNETHSPISERLSKFYKNETKKIDIENFYSSIEIELHPNMIPGETPINPTDNPTVNYTLNR